MHDSAADTAILWSGGKDCSLAHHLAVASGMRVSYLVTFAPPDAKFLAHPIPIMKLQAEALGVPHVIIETSEPYRESYIAGIERLRDEYGVRRLVTGDIDLVDGFPNWPSECAAGTGVEVVLPLWDRSRTGILRELIENRFKIVFSCVKSPWLGPEWLGREITPEVLEELEALNKTNGIDPCGENGEFHTMTLGGPQFKDEIRLPAWTPIVRGGMAYMGGGGLC